MVEACTCRSASWPTPCSKGSSGGRISRSASTPGRHSSCALGAAYEGIYRIPQDADGIRPKRLDLLFDCLDNEVRRCPACEKKRLPISAIIIHLNNHHQWTRQQIAQWLREDADARAARTQRP